MRKTLVFLGKHAVARVPGFALGNSVKNLVRGRPEMAYDYEKFIREMQKAGPAQVRDEPEPPKEARGWEEAHEQPRNDDATAVCFPLRWWVLGAYIAAALAVVGWLIFLTFTAGQADPTYTIVGAGIILIGMLGALPASLTIDSRGIHQHFFLGLWERSIATSDIRSSRQATRGDLRRDGLLFLQSSTARHQKGDYLPVIWVGSKTSRRYFLHTSQHSNASGFIRELERRGVQPHGYEGWETFMEARGVPVHPPNKL